MALDWYTFNVGTLVFDIILTTFSLFTVFVALAERKKTKGGAYAHKSTTGKR